jgi:hypothetical protein
MANRFSDRTNLPKVARQFCELVVKDGKVTATLWPDLSLLRVPDLNEVAETFSDRLTETPNAFEMCFRFRQFPEIAIRWQALHPTAAVAYLTYERQKIAETLLLLSGGDKTADVSAINAFEKTFRQQPNDLHMTGTLAEIGTVPRPSIVVFGNRGIGEADVAVDLIEWCLACAYFRWAGVL